MPREALTQATSWLARRAPYAGIFSIAGGLVASTVSLAAVGVAAAALVCLAAAGVAPRLALLAAAAVVAGAAIGAARIDAIGATPTALVPGERLTGHAYLSSAPRPGARGWSAEIRMTDGARRGARLWATLPERPAVPAAAATGAELWVSGTFARPAPSDSAFDFGAYLRTQGIAGALDVERVRVTGARRHGLVGVVDRIRTRSDEALAAGLPTAEAALARGMVIGGDEAIPPGIRDDFRDSGLGHVLAVSGQNVVLLCALALPLLMAAGLRHGVRIPVLIALISLYVPLAGGGASIQRAGLMGVAALVATALARPASRWYALGVAVCATLTLNPHAHGDPAWQLSFAAVVGILLMARRLAAAIPALPRAVADAIALTVAATVATAPLLAHHFGTLSLTSLPANVAALPLIAPIMWLGMSRAAIGQLRPVDGPCGDLADAANALLGAAIEPLLIALESLAALFADLPGASVDLRLAGPIEIGAAYLALAGGALASRAVGRRCEPWVTTAVARLRRLRRVHRLGLAVAATGTIVLALARGLSPTGPPASLTVTFLDVGQGDATLVQHPDGSAVLFDGGPPEGGVVRLLRRAGVRRLSVLVMTHTSRDHHGGLAELVERVPVDVLLDGGDGTRDPSFRSVVDRAAEGGTRVVKATAPLGLDLGALHVQVESPPPRPPGPPPEDPNPRAVVAVVSSGGFDLLLSGDAESDALLPLGLPDVDAIKVAHHGSADPGLGVLLEQVRPELASIPVGRNAYGHPAPSTLTALDEADVATWRNDRNGTVRVTVDGGSVRVDAERGGPVSGAP